LTPTQVRILQSESVQLFGGSAGVRDAGLFENALDRPRNKWHYDPSVSVFRLGGAYGFGMAKNHAFVDGNKRAALLAVRAFLFANGYLLLPDEIETVTVIEGLAAGSVSEDVLTGWIESNATKQDR
jgi:death on curing protein